MDQLSSSCGSNQTGEDFLFLCMGPIDAITGFKDDRNMETVSMERNDLHAEFHLLNVNPHYRITSSVQVRTRVLARHMPGPGTKDILYHALEVFHLVDENETGDKLPDMYMSIERQKMGIIMQLSTNQSMVKDHFQGLKRQESLKEMPLEIVGMSFSQVTEVLRTSDILYSSRNYKQFLSRFNKLMEENNGY